jgi:hypothetical protein
MKQADAPSAGWYPDPQGATRLRWWDGEDWAPQYRAPPTPSELHRRAATRMPAAPETARPAAALSRSDMEELVAQARQVARSEVDRAAGVFSDRARAATREIQPLISDYTSRAARVMRKVAIVGAVLLVGWFVFQAIAEMTFLEWLGERIDRLTD